MIQDGQKSESLFERDVTKVLFPIGLFHVDHSPVGQSGVGGNVQCQHDNLQVRPLALLVHLWKGGKSLIDNSYLILEIICNDTSNAL